MSGNSDFHLTNETVLRERVRSDSRLIYFPPTLLFPKKFHFCTVIIPGSLPSVSP